MILLVLSFLFVNYCLDLNTLNIDQDLITQKANVEYIDESSQITCEHMVVEDITVHRMQIDRQLSTQSIQLQFISPDPQVTQQQQAEEMVDQEVEIEPELLQNKRPDPNTIRFHGQVNFKKGVIHADVQADLPPKQGKFEANFIQVQEQSQWIEVDHDAKWTVKKIIAVEETDDQIEIQRVKHQIKNDIEHHSPFQDKNLTQTHLEEQIKVLTNAQKDKFDEYHPEMMKAIQQEVIVIRYDELPDGLDYVMIKAQFHLLSQYHQGNLFAWAQLDGKYQWIQPIKNEFKCGHYTLKQAEHSVDNIWSFPVAFSAKHHQNKLLIEFGISIKKDHHSQCERDEWLLSKLRKQVYLYGIDQFQLYYR